MKPTEYSKGLTLEQSRSFAARCLSDEANSLRAHAKFFKHSDSEFAKGSLNALEVAASMLEESAQRLKEI